MEDTLKNVVREQLGEGLDVLRAVHADATIHTCLVEAARNTAQALRAGNKLMVAGNGGSAADAQHLVAEFVCRLCEDRPALRAVALTTDSSILTAVGNDYGFDRIFARQLEAIGQRGDIFLGISASGNSPNILRALEQARSMGIRTLGLTGKSGGKMQPLCDLCLCVPSTVTLHIQEAHLALEHIFCLLVERIYFERDQTTAVHTRTQPAR